ATGYNFKSLLLRYSILGNNNGKIVYRDDILELIVRSWLCEGYTFVLEEGGDSDHDIGEANIVRTWKKQNGLISYFNCASLPNFALIEKTWQLLKKVVRSRPRWDD
ncbi:hypothetical protein GQ53DRAFT_652511, partial [Thozetella sp. PMI_491]